MHIPVIIITSFNILIFVSRRSIFELFPVAIYITQFLGKRQLKTLFGSHFMMKVLQSYQSLICIHDHLPDKFPFYFLGLFPTVLSIFPNSALQFGFYYMFKDIWNRCFAVNVRTYFCSYFVVALYFNSKFRHLHCLEFEELLIALFICKQSFNFRNVKAIKENRVIALTRTGTCPPLFLHASFIINQFLYKSAENSQSDKWLIDSLPQC